MKAGERAADAAAFCLSAALFCLRHRFLLHRFHPAEAAHGILLQGHRLASAGAHGVEPVQLLQSRFKRSACLVPGHASHAVLQAWRMSKGRRSLPLSLPPCRS